MFRRPWGKWVCLLAGGGMLLQTVSCLEATTWASNLANIVTAGGVIWLIRKITE